jgi:hypothetical protein
VRLAVRIVAPAALGACLARQPAAPVAKRSDVRVSATACLDADAVRAAVVPVLTAHRAEQAGLVIDVVATPAPDAGADVQLRVIRRDADVGLDRHYALAANDCPSTPQLLALAVDRWLTSFPEWAEAPEPRPQVQRWLEVAALVTASAIAPPIGADAELGIVVDLGGRRDRFGISAVGRTGVPQPAGEGQFLQIAALGGASWRHRFAHWETRVELRGGGLRVSGLGFAENHETWVPWGELAVFAGRRWSWGALGCEVAATALRDHAVTADGLVSQDIPLIRVGFSGTFEIVR